MDIEKGNKVPWTAMELARPLLTTFILVLAINIIINVSGFRAIFSASDNKSLISLGFFMLQELIFLLPFFLFFKNYELSAEILGFRKTKFGQSIILILKGFGLLFLFGFFLLIVAGQKDIPGFMPQESYFPLFDWLTNLDFYLAFLILVLFAPIVEELAFRGFILQALENSWGPLVGSLVTAFLFAAVHLQFQSFFLFLVPGLILNWIFLKSRSLVLSIAFHILNNSIAFIFQWLFFIGKFPSL